jgi:hypothetical protein
MDVAGLSRAELAALADGDGAAPGGGDREIAGLIAKYERDEDFDPYHFIPPGPVAEAFLNATNLTSFIMGPVGAGKTVACAFKRIYAATLAPTCLDGWKRCRWVVVRSTYRDAEKTVLASWQQWFHKGYPGSSWGGGNDRPVTHTLRFRLPSGERIEAITEFIGLNGMTVEAKLRGYEISGAWLNEADTLDEDALRYVEQRTGRYPMRDMLPAEARRMRTVIGDFNAPDVDNWVYQVFIERQSENRKLFTQPSGMSPDAENTEKLEPGYYEQMIADNEDWFVRRFVYNQFGYSRDGKPVYDTFNAAVHVAARPLDFDPNLDLLVGLDGGGGTLNPAAVYGQIHAGWQLHIIGELVPGHGYGPSRFGELLDADISDRFPGVRKIRPWADPASEYGGDKEGGQLAWIEIVRELIGVPILIPFAGSNEIALRLDAVKRELMTDGTTPNMLISPVCKLLIRGFASKYRYKKRPLGASTTYEPVPDKNDASHPHDALQYLVGGIRGRTAIVRSAIGRASRDAAASSGWSRDSIRPRRGRFDPTELPLAARRPRPGSFDPCEV